MKLPAVPQRTTPGFAFSIVNRALLDCIANRRFGAREIAELLAFFGEDPPACAFCGDRPISRWDHLVPVSSGGDTVLGNMVPACSACDDSKQHNPFEDWARGAAPGSPRSRGIADLEARVGRLHEYVAKYAYRARVPEERLSAEELAKLEDLRADLAKVRAECDALVKMLRSRTRAANRGGSCAAQSNSTRE